jgi:hypothetical protein
MTGKYIITFTAGFFLNGIIRRILNSYEDTFVGTGVNVGTRVNDHNLPSHRVLNRKVYNITEIKKLGEKIVGLEQNKDDKDNKNGKDNKNDEIRLMRENYDKFIDTIPEYTNTTYMGWQVKEVYSHTKPGYFWKSYTRVVDIMNLRGKIEDIKIILDGKGTELLNEINTKMKAIDDKYEMEYQFYST